MNEPIEMSESQKKAQRSRSMALGVALAAFVVIVYLVTWFKMGASILERPM